MTYKVEICAVIHIYLRSITGGWQPLKNQYQRSLIQDLSGFFSGHPLFKVYLMSCYLSYSPHTCPLRDLPVVLASFNQRFVIRRRLICKAGTEERLLELHSRVYDVIFHTLRMWRHWSNLIRLSSLLCSGENEDPLFNFRWCVWMRWLFSKNQSRTL